MQRLTNTVKDYAWGSPSGIPEILGNEPDGRPAAELWVGAHPGAPSFVDGRGLDDLIASDPSRYLGEASVARFGPRLPFLLKILSARTALSIQSHPSREQAIAGFAAESAAGIPLDAPHRNYRDEWHKPELLYALGEFHALCGFRPVPAIRATLDRFATALDAAEAASAHRESLAAWRDALDGEAEAGLETASDTGPEAKTETEAETEAEAAVLRRAVEVVLGDPDRFGALADALATALSAPSFPHVAADDPSHEGTSVDPALTLLETHADFPRDAGSLVAVMLRRFLLQAGESLAFDSGILHAYLGGLGAEIMASSDNVLRGGLTGKHIDVPELVRTVHFDTQPPRVLTADDDTELRGATDDFILTVVHDADDQVLPRPGALTALCIDGTFMLRSGDEELEAGRGDSVFIGADEPRPTLTGKGALFVASSALSGARDRTEGHERPVVA
ncbi:mannose-6-phosphate isomerase, class I [Brevibacterium yomogidense]|uniref:mannose-6-phosphate isomerase, class I n=1 Tax=Brevibacterium yomogidense TaxID=946573 RepID=UPI0018DF3955